MTTRPERTILLVEDSGDDRALLKRLLRGARDSVAVLEAATGEEALARIRAERPDLVLLDFHLPDMTGSQFLEDLAGSIVPPVPVIVLTGREDEEAASEVLGRGAMDYLVKGTLSGSGVLRAVENAIEKFGIQRELEEKRAALELRNWELEMLRDELQGRLAELADAHKAKDQFLAVMSHEMRTPLNAILGYADLLDAGIAGELSEAQRVHVDRIRVGGRHLLDLINDVLDLARVEARKLELDLRPVDVEAVLEEVMALLDSQAAVKGVRLLTGPCEGGLPLVEADLQRLRQILTNLVGNAIKFTEEGSVTVLCEVPDEETLLVRVTDTGIGIAPDVLPLIFSEFFQAEGDLTREHQGSGLGLAIAQRLARLMGGDIRAESELGEGSTFTLTLRRAAQGSARRDEDVAAHDARMRKHTAAVDEPEPPAPAVVVAYGDDGRALAALAERLAQSVRLLWTTDASRVPELARSTGAGLVVLDVSCHDGAAWRVAHALQEIPELAQTAVLLLPRIPTADEGEERGIDLGWVSLVPKPFTSEQLTRAVAWAAEGRREHGIAGGEPRPRRVLVVDDDPDSRRVATRFLQEAYATVSEAADGESALTMMRRSPPDVVVLDLMMPVLDGFGVLAAMQADPLLSGIPVVVLSAKTLTQAEREFLSRTATRVLQKGEHRLADVASLVLRAAGGAQAP